MMVSIICDVYDIGMTINRTEIYYDLDIYSLSSVNKLPGVFSCRTSHFDLKERNILKIESASV